MGSDVREIEVVADPAQLAQQQMTYADLATAIQASTAVNAVGRMPQDYQQYLIVTTTEAHSADDIANDRRRTRAARRRPRDGDRPAPRTTCASSPATDGRRR